MKKHILFYFLFVFYLVISCKNNEQEIANNKIIISDFSLNQDGWIGGFADYSNNPNTDYDLHFSRTTLPLPLDNSQFALKIGGTNRSDDLFMYIKKKITGLEPNSKYSLKFDIVFASNVPTGQVGVGGSPDAVFMKAGATIIEPLSYFSEADGLFRMNIDKGNQSLDGANMYNIGKIGVAENTTQYTLVNRNNTNRLFPISTNEKGEVWVIIGTDSGYEARTELYYHKIILTFEPN